MGVYKALRDIPDDVIGRYLDRKTRLDRFRQLDAPQVILDNQTRMYEAARQKLVQQIQQRGVEINPESIQELVDKAIIIYRARRPAYQKRNPSRKINWTRIEQDYSNLKLQQEDLSEVGVPQGTLLSDDQIYSHLSIKYGVPEAQIRTDIRILEGIMKGIFMEFERTTAFIDAHEDDEAVLEKANAVTHINEKIGKFVQRIREQRGVSRSIYELFNLGRAEATLFENGMKPLEDLPDGLLDVLGEALVAEEEIAGLKQEYHL